jgi:uncharacterized protein
MRREWTRLERGDTTGAWRNSQATFLAQVAGPHFETICRDWAQSSSGANFGEAPGEVAAGVVADPLRRRQIQIDVAVFAPDDPGRPRRVLSIGEAKWDKVMTVGHLGRLHRARDLLAVKGYDMSGTRLTCYSGAGFDPGRLVELQWFGVGQTGSGRVTFLQPGVCRWGGSYYQA